MREEADHNSEADIPTAVNNKCKRFISRQTKFIEKKVDLTDDESVIEAIEAKGFKLPFVNIPVQVNVSNNPSFSLFESNFINEEIERPLKMGAISFSPHEKSEFISPIFTIPMSEGSRRFILNV